MAPLSAHLIPPSPHQPIQGRSSNSHGLGDGGDGFACGGAGQFFGRQDRTAANLGAAFFGGFDAGVNLR
jgi:hypothetical protein